jgi:uracil-DNA glycosylase family 4
MEHSEKQQLINNKLIELDLLKEDIAICNRCPLFKTRSNTVPGEINLNSDIVFVYDAPNIDSDLVGKPMVGSSGTLFNSLIHDYMNLNREDVSVLTFIKCVPIYNSNEISYRPKRESVFWCAEYIYKQLEILDPKLIICLGYNTFSYLLRNDNAFFKSKEKISIKNYVGKLYKINSILDTSKSWFLIPCPGIMSFELNHYSTDVLKDIKVIYDKIRSGEDMEDLLRDSTSL